MKRANGQGKRSKKTAKHTKVRARGKVDVAAVQEEIRNLVCGSAIEMVQCAIEEVKKGHYAAMKFLFELVGLMKAAEIAADPEANMTAETLCQRLGIPIGPEPEVTNDSAAALNCTAIP